MHISRLRLAIYAVAVAFGILAAIPNVLPARMLASLPAFLPKNPVTLGLDLRGGSHLVLEVDSSGLVKERLQDLLAQTRSALRKANIDNSLRREAGAITINLRNPDDAPDALRLLKRR